MPTPGKIKDDRPFDKHLGGFWPSGGGNDKMSKHPPWDKDIFGGVDWDRQIHGPENGIKKYKKELWGPGTGPKGGDIGPPGGSDGPENGGGWFPTCPDPYDTSIRDDRQIHTIDDIDFGK